MNRRTLLKILAASPLGFLIPKTKRRPAKTRPTGRDVYSEYQLKLLQRKIDDAIMSGIS